MAASVLVAGVAEVQVYSYSAVSGAAGMKILGYTRNGVEITKEGFFLDVPGDSNGGDDGPPIDVQYHGETARIRCDLTKFDNALADEIKARIADQDNDNTPGTPDTAGALMFAGGETFRVLINSAGDPINFPRAFVRFPIEQNRGTKFSTLIFEFEAHADGSGTVYDADITGAA